MQRCLDCNKPKSPKGNYCKVCGYKHRIRPSGLIYKIIAVNRGWFEKGHKPHNTGLRGEFTGKTDDGLHDWVERNLGKSKNCSNCSSTKNIEWSNISGEYKTDLSDWQRLCKK